MRQLLDDHRRSAGLAAGALALVVAGIYLVVVPAQAEQLTGLRRSVLLYAHPLCWLLLAGTAACWALRGPSRLTATLGFAALATYAAFLLTLITA